jgi:hypothetical protein
MGSREYGKRCGFIAMPLPMRRRIQIKYECIEQYIAGYPIYTMAELELEIISGFIGKNAHQLADLYIKHESENAHYKYGGTGVFLVVLDAVNKRVNLDYIAYDIIITEKLDANILGKLKKNKPTAECGEPAICECGLCDMRPRDMFFMYCDETAGKNYVVEAVIH